MSKQITLENINRKEVLRYLGYKGIGADETVERLIDECEAKAIKAAVPRYTYRVVDVKQADDGVEIEGTGLVLKGNSIKEHLTGCDKAALIAVTLSDGIDRMLRVLQASDLAKAVVADSLASAGIEQVCDKLEAIIKEELPEYFSGKIKDISDEKFRILYGREIPDGSWSGEIQMNDAVCQLYYGKGILGKLLCAILKLLLKISDWKGKPNLNVLFNYNMPIRGYAKMTGGIVTMKMAEALTEMANGHRIKGTAHLIKAAINRD